MLLLAAALITLCAAPLILWHPFWAILLIILCLFSVLLVFRELLFKHHYKNPLDVGDAALLEYLVQQNSHASAEEEEVEMELLENALHLKQVRAQDCMAPRTEIIHVDVDAPVETLRQLFIESRLSRILVTNGSIDKVLGYVHVHQMFNYPKEIRKMVMPITFVPVSIPVNDLLHKFVKNRTNIACVVDEYGSLAGLVTLGNALEQLFGKIDDEHDQEEFIEVFVNPGEFLFSGRLEIEYLNEKYPELCLPDGDYNTLSGYLINALQTIPRQGVRLDLDGKTFILEMVSDRKIETVRILLPQ
jgi:CBS domain containing-hemolysin-like protein